MMVVVGRSGYEYENYMKFLCTVLSTKLPYGDDEHKATPILHYKSSSRD